LGSGSLKLRERRNSNGYLIWHHNKARVHIDAGSVTSVEYGKSESVFKDLQDILFTHLHVNHSADLSSFVKGGYITSRNANLSLYGPAANDLKPSTSNYLHKLMSDKS
jgi:ribonuclease BN (tRNA processing enzyme)